MYEKAAESESESESVVSIRKGIACGRLCKVTNITKRDAKAKLSWNAILYSATSWADTSSSFGELKARDAVRPIFELHILGRNGIYGLVVEYGYVAQSLTWLGQYGVLALE